MATASKKPAAKKATSDNQVKLVKDLGDLNPANKTILAKKNDLIVFANLKANKFHNRKRFAD